MTAAVSGMRARMDTVDMLANNLSNASTNGYKIDRERFSLFDSEGAIGESADSDLPFSARPWTDFSQGTLTPTANPLDFAISGRGFFTVSGESGIVYTRNGSFKVDEDGKLATQEGYPVLAKGGANIQLDPGQLIEVDKDGNVRQGGLLKGQLDLVDFKKPESLSKQGGSYFEFNGDATERSPATRVEVLQNTLESSNVQTSDIAVKIVGVMRQFEMLNKAITLAGEMNRRSIEEVARVGS